jgi:prolyl oligopeptidase
VQAWIEQQNAATRAALGSGADRDAIRATLQRLWRQTTYYAPVHRGPWYFHYKSVDGGPDVLWKTRRLDDDGEPLIDPSTLTFDGAARGSLTLANISPSEDGQFFAYVASDGSTPWNTWRVREVATGKDLNDIVRRGLYGTAAWALDGSGFYYGRVPRSPGGAATGGDAGALPPPDHLQHEIAFHRLGTDTKSDRVVFALPAQPSWWFEPLMTERGTTLVILQHQPDASGNRVLLLDLTKPGARPLVLVDDPQATSVVVGAQDHLWFVRTTAGAPHGRLVAIDDRTPAVSTWRTILPEDPAGATLVAVVQHSGRFVAQWRRDAQDDLRTYALDGTAGVAVSLPTLGTVFSLDPFLGRSGDDEMFFDFTSFDRPTTNYRYDLARDALAVWRQPKVDLGPMRLVVEQRFATGKDGTRVPLFLLHRQGLVADGSAATYLTAYGGFGTALSPAWNPSNAAWAALGGVYALAIVRGGGEYGPEWAAAGRGLRKQSAVDDLVAAAQLLLGEHVTLPAHLGVGGSGPGALLAAAAMVQRPALFGAVVTNRGPLDLLRLTSLGGGAQWTGEYGATDTAPGLAAVQGLSPVAQVAKGTRYPPLLALTGAQDPAGAAHALKMVAALQAAAGDADAARLRYEGEKGFAIPPVAAADRALAERTDLLLFLARTLGLLPQV